MRDPRAIPGPFAASLISSGLLARVSRMFRVVRHAQASHHLAIALRTDSLSWAKQMAAEVQR
jgi:hypothetical protein